MRAFCYAVVTSGHVTNMAVTSFDPPYPKTPCYGQTSWLCFYKTGVMAMDTRTFASWEYGFSTFLLLWSWPWSDDLYIRTWPV